MVEYDTRQIWIFSDKAVFSTFQAESGLSAFSQPLNRFCSIVWSSLEGPSTITRSFSTPPLLLASPWRECESAAIQPSLVSVSLSHYHSFFHSPTHTHSLRLPYYWSLCYTFNEFMTTIIQTSQSFSAMTKESPQTVTIKLLFLFLSLSPPHTLTHEAI